jgi:hypothetical protein
MISSTNSDSFCIGHHYSQIAHKYLNLTKKRGDNEPRFLRRYPSSSELDYEREILSGCSDVFLLHTNHGGAGSATKGN